MFGTVQYNGHVKLARRNLKRRSCPFAHAIPEMVRRHMASLGEIQALSKSGDNCGETDLGHKKRLAEQKINGSTEIRTVRARFIAPVPSSARCSKYPRQHLSLSFSSVITSSRIPLLRRVIFGLRASLSRRLTPSHSPWSFIHKKIYISCPIYHPYSPLPGSEGKRSAPKLHIMPFHPPSWSPPLPTIPDSVSVETFMFDENYGRYPLGYSNPPFTDGVTGKSYSALEVKERVEHLARALSRELGFHPDVGSEWDKVVGCFSLNTIDYLTMAWAVHRLGGIASCVNAAYSAHELEYQLKDSGAKAIFTCLPLMQTTMVVAKKLGIPKEKVYILDLPPAMTAGMKNPGLKTLDCLVREGAKLPKMQASDRSWSEGEGKRRCAFLCYSSGTSGLPKGKYPRELMGPRSQISLMHSNRPADRSPSPLSRSDDIPLQCHR